MAEIVGGGRPVNDAERRVIAHLRDHAPHDWLLLHNVEIPRRGDLFEVDLIVLTGHSLVVIDVKGTRGRIEVAGQRWFPPRREAFGSPVAKLRGTARALKGLLVDKHRELERVYVDSLVVLSSPDAELVDPGGREAGNVTSLPDLVATLADPGRVRRGGTRDAKPYLPQILDALNATVRRSTAPPRFGNWEVAERLGGDSRVTEYRAFNATVPGSETVLLRVYQADPLADQEQRAAERQRIANAYQSLTRIPAHPAVVRSRDFFAIDDESRFVLVLDDVHGRALHLQLQERRTDLVKGALRGMLSGLAHVHAHGVVHRALTPASVLVTEDGQAMLTGFDYAKGAPRAYTVANELSNVLDAQYVAPECHDRPDLMTPASDVYAAGVIAHQLLPDGAGGLVQEMLHPDAGKRPSAAEALAALDGTAVAVRDGRIRRLLRRVIP
ncbi:NERD domain-containing protein [Nonomuraea sp. NPDC003804]|uniref:methylation-associated defense system protein kinase MAD6 n=1 Tax=Nonomuraea sp. NPDC003804 TaxID=3154547 RepID=UPI0033A75CEF